MKKSPCKFCPIRSEPVLPASASATGWLGILAVALILVMSAGPVPAAESTNSAPPAATVVQKLPRTVGLDIIKQTVNPDKTVSLVFKWSEKGKETAVLLRFGKAPLPKDQLTPAQSALLTTLAPPATAASDAALDKRAAALVATMQLKDPAKQERVSAVLSANLRAVRDAHNAGLQLDESVHKELVAGLQADLTPEQIETVKDKLTVNKLPITFKVYHQILPNLTPEDDRKILDWLKKAREECLDVKNADEMAPIFKKYKTEIEHYLDSRGYEWAKSYKAFVDGQKAKTTKSPTNSAPASK